MKKAGFFIDPRDLREAAEDLIARGFQSVETNDSHFEPMISFVGEEEDIEDWGDYNQFGITNDDLIIFT